MAQSYPKNHISFTLVYAGTEFRIQTYWGEYRDLRALIADRLFMDEFGECGGMGRCATCMIEISGLNNEAADMKRNEPTTLAKAGAVYPNVRLACQIPVTDDLANTVVLILDNR